MKKLSLAFASLALIHLCACSSSSKNEEKSADTEASASEPLTLDSVTERSTITELSSAANLLRAINERAAELKGDENPGEQVIGCKLAGKDAKVMGDILKGLIQRRQTSEAQDYALDPKVYAKSNGFETCGGECSCGALAGVVERVSSSKVGAQNTKVHSRFVANLNAKARLQTKEQTLTCAKKQTWFCSSDLKKVLEKSAGL